MVQPTNSNLHLPTLRATLQYNPCTGLFLRKTGQFKGKIAGWIAKDGYRYLMYEKLTYLAHRLAWFYVYGKWPESLIDHIDNDNRNECFFNFREATYSQNTINSKGPNINKSSDYKGVSRAVGGLKWDARIKKDGIIYYLGAAHNSEQEAALSYNEKALELFGPFAILNKIREI
jgi:HNH endonuclease